MDQWTPLAIIITTVVLLWAVGKFITKLSRNLETPTVAAVSSSSKIFADDLHVEGMSNVLIREAQEIITHQDVKALSYFFARYRPQFVELEEYLANLRSQYFSNLGKPSKLASEVDKINAVNNLDLDIPPTSIDMGAISSAELRYMVEKTLKSSNIITDDFMQRFGGIDFFDNFQVYIQLANLESVTLHIDPKHQFRKQMETFVSTDVAIHGRKIPLKERLEVLSFNQLKEMAINLKVNKQFSDKSEIAEALAQMPGSAIHLAMIYKSENIFYIKAESVDAKSIEEEWSVLTAYAKLLIGSLKNSFVSFDEQAAVFSADN